MIIQPDIDTQATGDAPEDSGCESHPTEIDPATRRRQLEQLIDRTLGPDFPADRRERLWAAQQRVDELRRDHQLRDRWLEITHRRTMPGTDGEATVNVADAVLRTWARALDARELAGFLGADKEAEPNPE
jgi:hypothetical protein